MGSDGLAAVMTTSATVLAEKPVSRRPAVGFLRDHLLPATAAEPITAPEVLRTVRAITALERINTPEARGAIERLAQGNPDAIETREAMSTLDRWNAAR